MLLEDSGNKVDEERTPQFPPVPLSVEQEDEWFEEDEPFEEENPDEEEVEEAVVAIVVFPDDTAAEVEEEQAPVDDDIPVEQEPFPATEAARVSRCGVGCSPFDPLPARTLAHRKRVDDSSRDTCLGRGGRGGGCCCCCCD